MLTDLFEQQQKDADGTLLGKCSVGVRQQGWPQVEFPVGQEFPDMICSVGRPSLPESVYEDFFIRDERKSFFRLDHCVRMFAKKYIFGMTSVF
jgi:hypothetical protein